MINWWWEFAALPPGIIFGWACSTIAERHKQIPTDQQIATYMNRVVNQEEMSEHERITKFRMARNGRKTQRFDGGPNARITKMRVRPVPKRFRRG